METGAETGAGGPTRYDRIAYPSGVFAHMGPNRMRVMAHLHGIDAPPIETARVLEIGGNDGRNLLAFAAANPRSDCLTFDVAPGPVKQGRALARAAGVANVRIEQRDLLDAAHDLEGQYDYVIAHGVYAWVPDPVRDALRVLVGRVLSPNGVAAISYNTLPGHALGQTLRGMMAAEVGPEPDDRVRFDKTMAALRAYADGDMETPAETRQEAFRKTLRAYARELLTRPEALLAHDEFGGFYEPQTVENVVGAMKAVGLAYLNDALHKADVHGFGGETDQAALVRRMQADDYRDMAFFRHSLFVRDDVAIDRRLDLERLEPLWLWSNARRTEPGRFARGSRGFDVRDNRASTILVEAGRRCPGRLPLAGMSPEQLQSFAELFLTDAVALSFRPDAPPAFSERPRLSRLARAQIERGDERLATLEQGVAPASGAVRDFMLLFDGTRDIATLAAEAGVGVAEATAVVAFVGASALLEG